MKRRGEEGLALMIALLMIVLLTVIVIEFAYEMQVEASLVQHQVDTVASHLAAKSAVAAGLGLLTTDLIEQQTGDVYDSFEDIWWTSTHPYGHESRHPLDKGFYQRSPDGQSELMITIEDEWGKIPLNALVPGGAQAGFGLAGGAAAGGTGGSGMSVDDGMLNETLIEALHSLFVTVLGVADDPTAAIVDWIDPDDAEYGSGGAEQAYYDTLERPYRCKNGPLDSVEELLLIRGITPELYYGDPDNDIPPLYELLTVHGNPRGRVNLNTAPYEVLLALEEAGRGRWAGMADEIVQARANTPFATQDDVEQRLTSWPVDDPQNPDPMPKPPLDVVSRVFHIQGDGHSNGVKTRIDAYVWRDLGEGAERYRFMEWRVTR